MPSNLLMLLSPLKLPHCCPCPWALFPFCLNPPPPKPPTTSSCHHVLYLLLSCFTFFTHPLDPLSSGNHQFVLCFYEFVSVLHVHLFYSLDSTYKWNHMVFFFVWFFSLCSIPSSSIHIVTKGKISILFYGWAIYIAQFIYPTVCWWTFRLLPYLGYCK